MNTFVTEDIQRLDSMIARADRVCVVSHFHPDGDAVGSSTAMCRYLEQVRGKRAVVVLPGKAQDALEFLTGPDVIDAAAELPRAQSELTSCDLLICLDCRSFGRTEFLETALLDLSVPKILIDHHLDPAREDFDLVFSETEISSASELLYHILRAMPGIDGDTSLLPLPVLTSLMTGMTTDTNNFANSVFPSTLAMASDLLACGVDRDAIIRHLYQEFRPNRLLAQGWLLDNSLKITPDGVAYMILDSAAAVRFDLRDGETEGFVNLPLAIKEVRLSILLKQDKEYFRVSLRSKPGTSAVTLAGESFHGGGHECAAGGRLYCPGDIDRPEEAAAYIERVTARFLHKAVPGNNE